ncbi:MAG: DUF4097 family beta strand repeat protein [Lachnospiraceae bacterium]|nr:DUF4097 family beta strand repeat protein [Lachnospiraceae bacterium]
MNKHEFLRLLEMNLRIGSDEKAEVMSYYGEYFEEAGPENEQAVIAELGDPVDLAKKLNQEFDADMGGQAAQGTGQPDGSSSGTENAGYYRGGARNSGYYNFNNLGTSIGDAVRAAVEAALGVAGEAINEAGKVTDGIRVDIFDEADSIAEAEEELRTAEEEAREAVEEAEEELRNAEAEAEDARAEVEDAKAEVEAAMKDLEAAKKDVEAAKAAVEAALAAMEGLSGDEAIDAEETLNDAESDLEDAETAEQDAEEALADATDTRRDAESDLRDAEREVRSAKRAVEVARREGEREIRRARRELNEAMRKAARENREDSRYSEKNKQMAEDLKQVKEDIRQAAKETKETVRQAEKEAREAVKQAAKEAGAATIEVYQGTKGVFTSLRDILWGGSAEQEYYSYTNDDMEPFTSAMVDVSNCPIRVERSETGRFGVDVRLLVHPDDQVIVAVENGVLTVKKVSGRKLRISFGNSSASQYVKLYLPEMEYDRLDLITSNATVAVSNVSRIRDILNIDTSNSGIKVEGVLVDDRIKLDTSNSAISVKQVCCKVLEADSSNGGIGLEDVAAMRATLDTSNGGIKVKNCEINELLNADTSNGSIEVLLPGNENDYRIIADTSNAKVYVNGRCAGDSYTTRGGTKAVRLDTSNGRITIGFMQ